MQELERRIAKLEGLAQKRRQADAPEVVIVIPDSAAGHRLIDGKAIMLQSAADRLSDELTARGERPPCFVHFDAEYLDL